jgi:hypothetical protein
MATTKSNISFGLGVFFLLAGLFFFMTFWLMYLGFACLGFGTILILLSRHKWYYQLIAIGLPIGYVGFSILNAFAQPEAFLIPENFKGVVYVIYDEQIGEPKEYEGLRRVYKIPKSGVLFTQFKQTQGIHNRKFYSVAQNGDKKELGTLDYRDYNESYTINPKPTEPPRDSLAVFTPEVRFDPLLKTKHYYTTFTVGKYQDIKSWNFLYPDYIDSLKQEKLKNITLLQKAK